MKIKIIIFGLLLAIAFLVLAGCQARRTTVVMSIPIETPKKDYSRQLPPGELALRKITDPNQIPDYTKACANIDGLKDAIARSLSYMAKPSSEKFYPYGDITHEHAV
jgi:membrane-bound lytic murein transglycosylase A